MNTNNSYIYVQIAHLLFQIFYEPQFSFFLEQWCGYLYI